MFSRWPTTFAVTPLTLPVYEMVRGSPSSSTSLANTLTVPGTPTANRIESGLATGGVFAESMAATSTVTSVFALVPPCGSTDWYVKTYVPGLPGGGVYRSAGSPVGPFASVIVALSRSSNAEIVNMSRSGSMSLASTSMMTGRSIRVLTLSGRAIGGRLGLSGGNSSTFTVAVSSAPWSSVIVYSNESVPLNPGSGR